jgi:hypothetical protein
MLSKTLEHQNQILSTYQQQWDGAMQNMCQKFEEEMQTSRAQHAQNLVENRAQWETIMKDIHTKHQEELRKKDETANAVSERINEAVQAETKRLVVCDKSVRSQQFLMSIRRNIT